MNNEVCKISIVHEYKRILGVYLGFRAIERPGPSGTGANSTTPWVKKALRKVLDKRSLMVVSFIAYHIMANLKYPALSQGFSATTEADIF